MQFRDRASVREPLPTRQPLRDFHPGLNFHSPPCHHVGISPLVMWNALLRSVTDWGPIQMHVTSFYLSRDLYRQTLQFSTR
ncbi:hypothetical protein [Nostoc sp. DedQUE04]|uniref:hypothetical protein n=1 Tax=Nostoc sp. DedQUE04 TaxID=3075390 RepID=UPI002AD4C84B|nr:hypothetical protein [Nostoc sp. DedQUE04]